jgi:hypothetical protein
VVFVLLGSALATIAAWILPFYFFGDPTVFLIREGLDVAAVILATLVLALGKGTSRGPAIVLAAIAGLTLITHSFIVIPFDWDRPHNPRKALRLVQRAIQRNQEYVKHHQGTFANGLDQLGVESSTEGYTISYNPAWDPDHVVRHYVVRAIPLSKDWPRSYYADESGVIRFSDDVPAGKDSAPL